MYDFKQLSPADFEDLTRDLLQQEWDVRLEAFKSGRDQGIDLRHAIIPGRSTIIQCKHRAGSNVTRLVYALRSDEAPKVARLTPDRYVLVTSLPLNPSDKEKIRQALHPYILTLDDVLGADDINNLLGRHPAVEKQHFKLWLTSTAVLERVLFNAEAIQTDFDVQRVRRALPLYVQTDSFGRALDILRRHRVVIISGVPGIGKTTLADMLLFAHLESNYEPMIIKTDISEGKRLLKDKYRQIFYFDDFLGQTFLGNRTDFVGRKEDIAILDFIDIVAQSKHTRLILTTREHILQNAFQVSERFQRQRQGIGDRRCILDLNDYTLLDRGRILYNHIYFSDLPDNYKYHLLKDNFYMHILRHKNFNPRLIEWLSRYTNLRSLSADNYQDEVRRVLENPEQLWRIAFEQQISDASRSLLLALYSVGSSAGLDHLEEVWRKLHQFRSRKYNWKTAPEDWRRSLQDLEGGFLSLTKNWWGQREVGFVNPSVKDFLDSTLCLDFEHMDDILSSACSFDQIVNVWALATSEKGARLQERFGMAPQHLVRAINENLGKPYDENEQTNDSALWAKARDSRPELRLRTAISIADSTKSLAALEACQQYACDIIHRWSTRPPDYDLALQSLQTLDQAVWPALLKLDLHSQIKDALLCQLGEKAGSGDLDAVVNYAKAEGSKWSEKEQTELTHSFHRYLENEFNQELADCANISDLDSLSNSLESIGDWCGIDVTDYELEMAALRSEMNDADDDDSREDGPKWDGASRTTSELAQVVEVTRLFDGLRES